MAVRIRLTRIGKKKQPYYRVIVNDKRRPRDADYIEQVGYYDPNQDPEEVRLDAERIEHWIENGAQPSDTVRRLIRKYTEVVVPRKRGRSEPEEPVVSGDDESSEAETETTSAESGDSAQDSTADTTEESSDSGSEEEDGESGDESGDDETKGMEGDADIIVDADEEETVETASAEAEEEDSDDEDKDE